jgi:hypothetical protein
MKRSIISILALTFVLIVACTTRVNDLESPGQETRSDEDAETEKNAGKSSKNRVSINPLVGKYTVSVGQQVSYTAKVNGSVGLSASAQSSEEEILAFDADELEFNDKKAAEMRDGAYAQRTFIFKAIKPGKATVIVQHMFRGELENEYEIVINVVK